MVNIFPLFVVWLVLVVMSCFNERNDTWCKRLLDMFLGTLVIFAGLEMWWLLPLRELQYEVNV